MGGGGGVIRDGTDGDVMTDEPPAVRSGGWLDLQLRCLVSLLREIRAEAASRAGIPWSGRLRAWRMGFRSRHAARCRRPISHWARRLFCDWCTDSTVTIRRHRVWLRWSNIRRQRRALATSRRPRHQHQAAMLLRVAPMIACLETGSGWGKWLSTTHRFEDEIAIQSSLPWITLCQADSCRRALGRRIREPVADLVQHPGLVAPEMDETTGRTRPANHRLVSVTATARMPTVPK